MKIAIHKGIPLPATQKEMTDKALAKLAKQGIDPFEWLKDYYRSLVKGKSKQERKKLADQMIAEMHERECLRKLRRN